MEYLTLRGLADALGEPPEGTLAAEPDEVVGYLAEAMSRAAAEAAARATAQADEPSATESEPDRAPDNVARDASAEVDDALAPDLPAQAEKYAIIYPRRAQLIRRVGGLPARCDFGPPEHELVQAIVHGRSPALLALDADANVF